MSWDALREAALKVAVTQDNTRPLPGKIVDGPKMAEYLAAVGRGPGLDYCVAFVYWCYQQASRELGCPNPLPVTAGTHDLHRKVSKRGWIVDKPQRGDIFLSPGLGHTGMVHTVQSIQSCLTIEGNTMIGTSDWGVHFRKHKNLTGSHFVRVK